MCVTQGEPKVILLFPPQTILQQDPFMGNNDVAQFNTASPPLFQVLTIPGITSVLVGRLVSEPTAPAALISACDTVGIDSLGFPEPPLGRCRV